MDLRSVFAGAEVKKRKELHEIGIVTIRQFDTLSAVLVIDYVIGTPKHFVILAFRNHPPNLNVKPRVLLMRVMKLRRRDEHNALRSFLFASANNA